MTDSTDICKMALSEIGSRSTISSLADQSVEAKYCTMYYSHVRDQALRAARWNFAGRTDTIDLWKALPGTPERPTPPSVANWQRSYPAPPWLYSYTAPADFIYARSVIAQQNTSALPLPIFPFSSYTSSSAQVIRVPFAVSIDPWSLDGLNPVSPGRKVILTNASVALFEWTSQQVTEDLWDSEFVMVMVLAMAARLAIALTSDKQLAQLKMQSANAMIEDARAKDANEGITVLDYMPDWLTVRGVSGWDGSFNFYYPYGPLFSFI